MSLVSSAEVQEIYPLVINGVVIDMTPFITSAHLMVSEDLGSSGYSSERLKRIELYLAAHFALTTYERGGITKQKSLDAEDTYAGYGNAKVGLAGSRFGQQALSLDTNGMLTNTGTGKLKALFRVIGAPPSYEN